MPQTPGIATLDELKAYLDVTRGTDDTALQAVLDGVTQRVESYTGRRFRPDPPLDDNGNDTLPAVQRTVVLRRSQRRVRPWREDWDWDLPRPLTLDIPDARQLASVTGTQITFTSYAPLGDAPWRRIELYSSQVTFQDPVTALPSVVLTGRFGLWPAPADVKDAVLIMASRRWRERDAAYGDIVQLPEGMTVSFFKQFPPTVQATLDLYTRKVRMV